MAVKDLAFTAYPANDVAKLAKFYEEVVGLELNDTMGEGSEMKYAEFKVGTGWFSIITAEWANGPAGQQDSVVFEVDDLEKTLADLQARGLETDRPHDTPVCRIASCKDPEGNSIGLHQTTVPH